MADCCRYHCSVGGNREKAIRFDVWRFPGSYDRGFEERHHCLQPGYHLYCCCTDRGAHRVAAAGKLKQPKRALVRAQAPIAILLAVALSINWVILGVEYSVVNSVFAENVNVSDETMASGRAIADQIASEGIVLLKNDDKALPLSAGTKLNLFGWSSIRPLYGGTGSGDSDTSNAVSLIDGLKHAGFEICLLYTSDAADE